MIIESETPLPVETPQIMHSEGLVGNESNWTLPNAISVGRLVGSFLLIGIAIADLRFWFVGIYGVLAISDWVDGLYARKMNQRSPLGATLDSAADIILTMALIAGVAILCTDALRQEAIWVVSAIGSYLLVMAFAWRKYGKLTSYHTRTAKITHCLVAIAGVSLLLEWSAIPFRVAAVSAMIANFEAIAITYVLPRWQDDIKSIFSIWPVRPRGVQKSAFTARQIREGLEGLSICLLCYLTLPLQPFRNRWGLSRSSASRRYPGDSRIPDPFGMFTHAIELRGTPQSVWPWLAQIGQNRGGFYSYEALENIMGYQIYNSDIILPEHQNIRLNDRINFAPGQSFPVVELDPPHTLVIGIFIDQETGDAMEPTTGFRDTHMHVTWLFHVEPLTDSTCRLISRCRYKLASNWKNRCIRSLFEPVMFTMDRKMLKGIKWRVERAVDSSTDTIHRAT